MSHMPRVFVEETLFDSCQLVFRGNGTQGFFAMDRKLQRYIGRTWSAARQIFSAALVHDPRLRDTLHYPLKRSIHVFGYLIFGKKQPISLDANICVTWSCSARS